MPPSEKGIHDGHRDRLKNRFLKEGLDHFEPHNVLELLLFYAIPVRDTNELAHRLITHFGSISAVFDADYRELLRVKGVGAHAALLIKLIPSLARYYGVHADKRPVVFQTVEQIAEFIRPYFIARTEEAVYLLALGNKGQVLFGDIVFQGSVNAAPIYIREIIELVVRTKASAVVLAHNHPGGLAIPSNKDLVTTLSVRESLDAMEVHLLDHLIFAGSDYVSFRDSNYI